MGPSKLTMGGRSADQRSFRRESRKSHDALD